MPEKSHEHLWKVLPIEMEKEVQVLFTSVTQNNLTLRSALCLAFIEGTRWTIREIEKESSNDKLVP